MDAIEAERFRLKITTSESGCHEWAGAITSEGYGQMKAGGKVQYAHRLAYEYAYGPIADGLVIDHLCRNRKCVNPEHLESVTSRENIVRGVGPTAIRAQMTHCVHGHHLSGDNLYVKPNGNRVCRTCKNHYQNRRRAERRKQ